MLQWRVNFFFTFKLQWLKATTYRGHDSAGQQFSLGLAGWFFWMVLDTADLCWAGSWHAGRGWLVYNGLIFDGWNDRDFSPHGNQEVPRAARERSFYVQSLLDTAYVMIANIHWSK